MSSPCVTRQERDVRVIKIYCLSRLSHTWANTSNQLSCVSQVTHKSDSLNSKQSTKAYRMAQHLLVWLDKSVTFALPQSIIVTRLFVTHLSDCIQPGVQRVTGDSQIRLTELVTLGPSKRYVAKTFLNDSMEPRQQEIQTSSLTWRLGRVTRKEDVIAFSSPEPLVPVTRQSMCTRNKWLWDTWFIWLDFKKGIQSNQPF